MGGELKCFTPKNQLNIKGDSDAGNQRQNDIRRIESK